MSQPPDELHFVPPEWEDGDDERGVETNNVLMYGIVALIACLGIVLSFVF